MSSRKRLSGLLFLLVLVLSLTACETLSYYSQAIGGQLHLLTHRKNIQKLINRSDTPVALQEKLETVLEIRDFAESELDLPLGKTFTSYVDIERPYVVWNVFATPEFSMDPVTWCYPVAGCVSYRGYFSEDRAREYADKLREEGFDVYVGGVTAYSTLGWFADPLLNTVIGRDEHELAALIFHELAHQQIYLKGDTDFNESFATTVEREGLRRWLDAHYSDQTTRELMNEAQEQFNRREAFVALVQQTTTELEKLYAEPLDADQMRKGKAEIMGDLRTRYQDLKNSWGEYSGYDNWFSQPLNNAQLSTVATYFRWVSAFEYLLEQQQGNLPAFYSRVEELSGLESEQLHQELEALLPESN